MSDAKHSFLSPAQLEEIKKNLNERKSALESDLAELYQPESAPDMATDIADQVQQLSLETLKTSLQDTDLGEYNRILQALCMIEDGTYGICVDCSQPILHKRLQLYPNATRCLVCQELLEDQQETTA